MRRCVIVAFLLANHGLAQTTKPAKPLRRVNWRAGIELYDIQVGAVGAIKYPERYGVADRGLFDFKIMQIIGPEDVLIEQSEKVQTFGRIILTPHPRQLLWFHGFKTAGWVDGTPINVDDLYFEVTGTRTYGTASGSSKTVFVFEPFDPQPYIQEEGRRKREAEERKRRIEEQTNARILSALTARVRRTTAPPGAKGTWYELLVKSRDTSDGKNVVVKVSGIRKGERISIDVKFTTVRGNSSLRRTFKWKKANKLKAVPVSIGDTEVERRADKNCGKCHGQLQECTACYGRGKLKCPRCSGTGSIKKQKKTSGSGRFGTNTSVVTEQCPRCKGRGNPTCKRCDGTGFGPCPKCG